jgi:hypothetical protein
VISARSTAGIADHILRALLIDRYGDLRTSYRFGALDARLVLAHVKTLMVEQLQ